MSHVYLLFFLLLLDVFAEEDASIQPYIDQLQQKIQKNKEGGDEIQSSEVDPYIQSIKRKSEKGENYSESYIEGLKKKNPEKFEPKKGESFIDQKKQQLNLSDGNNAESGNASKSAINALHDGRSELHAKKSGIIQNAIGLRLGVSRKVKISSVDSGADNFSGVYGEKWTPDLTVFYEHWFLRSADIGFIGLIFGSGISYYRGYGSFQFQLNNPSSGQPFESISKTAFQFFTVPLTMTANYRFHFLKYIQPYIHAGPGVMGYLETRNDDKGWKRGVSGVLLFGAGIAFPLGWIEGRSDWDLYTDSGIRQLHLLVEYNQLRTFSGKVMFETAGWYAGLVFEY